MLFHINWLIFMLVHSIGEKWREIIAQSAMKRRNAESLRKYTDSLFIVLSCSNCTASLSIGLCSEECLAVMLVYLSKKVRCMW